MSYTKRQFVEGAFEEIGLASYVYDLQPEQLQSALKRLDSMMATWNTKGIRLGYPLPSSPEDSDLDAETNVPDSANQAILTGLGIIIAPSYGRVVSQDTKVAAKQGYLGLLALSTKPMEKQLPDTMPLGAGNKPFRDINREYVKKPTDPLLAGDDGPIEFN